MLDEGKDVRVRSRRDSYFKLLFCVLLLLFFFVVSKVFMSIVFESGGPYLDFRGLLVESSC